MKKKKKNLSSNTLLAKKIFFDFFFFTKKFFERGHAIASLVGIEHEGSPWEKSLICGHEINRAIVQTVMPQDVDDDTNFSSNFFFLQLFFGFFSIFWLLTKQKTVAGTPFYESY